MGKPYSEDLRARVVAAEQDGTTIPETAERFGVSISSVVRLRRPNSQIVLEKSHIPRLDPKNLTGIEAMHQNIGPARAVLEALLRCGAKARTAAGVRVVGQLPRAGMDVAGCTAERRESARRWALRMR
jgi:hypothetical protein